MSWNENGSRNKNRKGTGDRNGTIIAIKKWTGMGIGSGKL